MTYIVNVIVTNRRQYT